MGKEGPPIVNEVTVSLQLAHARLCGLANGRGTRHTLNEYSGFCEAGPSAKRKD